MEKLQDVTREYAICQRILEEMKKVIVGKDDQLRLLLVCLLSRGHVLIEDVPGVGKTTAAAALARASGLEYKRVQFTPDVMATDISGFSVPDGKTGEFVYKPGVCMTNILIADEINRTSPKTQSALLEVMEERQVTVDGITHRLPEPFMVIATQNPVGYVGTYPLPEAQLDRFLMKTSMGYPTAEEEKRIVSERHGGNPLEEITAVSSAEEILGLQKTAERIFVDEAILDYIVNLVSATRDQAMIALAASPRASLSLMRAACASALTDGRAYVTPKDVNDLFSAVVSHRVMLAPDAKIERLSASDILNDLKETVSTPIVK